MEGPLKAKHSIIHDIVDDERFKKHRKDMLVMNSSRKSVELETIQEEN